MKKFLALVALLVAGISGMNAQESLKWGITAGLNSSNFSVSGFDSRIGFHAGVKAEMGLPQLADGIYLDMGALLSLKGAKVDLGPAGSVKYNPFYLEIPIHMGYKYAVNDKFAIFGNFGPYIGIGLFGKAKASGELMEGEDTSVNVFGDDAMKRFDFGLGLKAGVELNQKYQLSIGYDWGLIDNIEDSGNKNLNLMISLVYFL